ncbi:MAG TPA: carbamoyltransferase N-terminal domain-containing protein [Kofleriaceae bacterium]|nr:carbamoyltransferase N-terminal domain-containing protein [Kofleriaceae bacterium]HMG56181.1 carbamoyltransferase N-terminal domain-containing protein [Kofleriaceae bacterium]
MAAVLGISGEYHDAAAALVVDGAIVAAIQEERLSRIKNDPRLPLDAARACLAHAGLAAGDLDRVVFYEDPIDKLERVLVSTLRTFPRSLRQFPRAIGAQLGGKIWVIDRLAEQLGVARDRVTSTAHHLAHAASAFFVSGYPRAAVLTVDGVGEATSTALWHGDGSALRELGRIEYPHSLGLLYAGLTAYLGFEVNEGEYKVMGLAAYGQPRLRDEFARLIRLSGDGTFELGLPYFAYLADAELGFGPAMEQLLGPRRPPHRPWDLSSAADQRYADIAATLQAVTEDALLGLAREARRRTGESALCLAGGVALNAVANARLERESGFDRICVHPAAGDAGGALGAAILGSLELGDPRPAALTSAALGLPIDVAAAAALAGELGLTVRRSGDIPGEVAGRIAGGEIVAFCQGRFEWGPRALGCRSILANPADPESRERLNRAIKRREPFRPFAPAVLRDRAAEYFAGAPSDLTPFMTTVCPIAERHREQLAAVRHVDGTARVQTVTPDSAPELAAVLAALDRAIGMPIALNTSLNGAGEPIVGDATDAIGFLLGHPIDALVVGDLVITRGAA